MGRITLGRCHLVVRKMAVTSKETLTAMSDDVVSAPLISFRLPGAGGQSATEFQHCCQGCLLMYGAGCSLPDLTDRTSRQCSCSWRFLTAGKLRRAPTPQPHRPGLLSSLHEPGLQAEHVWFRTELVTKTFAAASKPRTRLQAAWPGAGRSKWTVEGLLIVTQAVACQGMQSFGSSSQGSRGDSLERLTELPYGPSETRKTKQLEGRTGRRRREMRKVVVGVEAVRAESHRNEAFTTTELRRLTVSTVQSASAQAESRLARRAVSGTRSEGLATKVCPSTPVLLRIALYRILRSFHPSHRAKAGRYRSLGSRFQSGGDFRSRLAASDPTSGSLAGHGSLEMVPSVEDLPMGALLFWQVSLGLRKWSTIGPHFEEFFIVSSRSMSPNRMPGSRERSSSARELKTRALEVITSSVWPSL